MFDSRDHEVPLTATNEQTTTVPEAPPAPPEAPDAPPDAPPEPVLILKPARVKPKHTILPPKPGLQNLVTNVDPRFEEALKAKQEKESKNQGDDEDGWDDGPAHQIVYVEEPKVEPSKVEPSKSAPDTAPAEYIDVKALAKAKREQEEKEGGMMSFLMSGLNKLKQQAAGVNLEEEERQEAAAEQAIIDNERKQEEKENHAREARRKSVREQARTKEEKAQGDTQSFEVVWDYLEKLITEVSATESKSESKAGFSLRQVPNIEKTIQNALQSNPHLLQSFLQIRGHNERRFDDLDLNFEGISDDESGTLFVANGFKRTKVDIKKLVQEASEDCHLTKKMKVACYAVTDSHGNQKLNLVWHANSGEARFVERRVLDHIVHALLEQGHASVQVSALTHQNAYQQNAKNELVSDEYGHMVWDPAFADMFGTFKKQRICNLSVSKAVIKKTRGETDDQVHFSAVDGLACPQLDRAGLRVNDANMVTWTAIALKPNEKVDNSTILEDIAPPTSNSVIDFHTGNTHFSAHMPISSEDSEMSWELAADMSRKGPKAFKAKEDIYEQKALEDLPGLKAKRQALVMDLFITATNRFLDADKGAWTKEQKEAYIVLRDLLYVAQGHPESTRQRFVPKPSDISSQSFTNFTDNDTVRAFIGALNCLIAKQVQSKELQNQSLAKVWQDALEQWRKTPRFVEFAGFLKVAQKPEHKAENKGAPQTPAFPNRPTAVPAANPAAGQANLHQVRLRPVGARLDTAPMYKDAPLAPATKAPKKHPTHMSGAELRLLSNTPTGSGGADPLKMLLGAFGCEESSGYNAINGSTTETNESMGRHQLFGKLRLIMRALLRSTKPVAMVVIEGADNERSPSEIANKSILEPHLAVPHMVFQLVDVLKIMNHVLPSLQRSAQVQAPVLQATYFESKKDQAPSSPLATHSGGLSVQVGEDNSQLPSSTPKSIDEMFAKMKHLKGKLETKYHYIAQEARYNKEHKEEGDKEPKEYEGWTVADKAQHIMYKHFIQEGKSLAHAESRRESKWPKKRLLPAATSAGLFGGIEKSEISTSKLIKEVGEAILDFEDKKNLYLQINKENAKSKDVDLKGLEQDYLNAQKKVNACCEKMKKRTGWQNFRNVCLVMAGIILVAAAVSLLVMSFGGFAPLSVGLATLGITITATTAQAIAGGCLVGAALTIPAYRKDFLGKSANYKFAEQTEADVKTFAAAVK